MFQIAIGLTTFMRLLALTTSYPLRERAVAGVFVQRLYQHMPGDWSILVLCPDDSVGAKETCSGAICTRPVRYAPTTWQSLSQAAGGINSALQADRKKFLLVPMLLGAMLIRCVLAAHKADLIHANWSVCGALAVIVGWLTRRPVVTTLRGDDVGTANGSLISRCMLALTLRGSTKVVCVSDAMAEGLRQRNPHQAEKIVTCRNGVENSFLNVRCEDAGADQLRIAAVGSLVRRKGFDVLIDALTRMRGVEHASLRIAGDGPERVPLAEQAQRAGLESKVALIGEHPHEEMPGFLAMADVFVLSSRSEGRPNVVVEALASGLPVITTDLPGVTGLVIQGVNGWVVPVDDPYALANALDEAYADSMRRKAMGNNARARIIAASESWTETAVHYDAIFREAIDRYAGESN